MNDGTPSFQYKNSIKAVCLCIFLYFDKIVSLLDNKVSFVSQYLLYLCRRKEPIIIFDS